VRAGSEIAKHLFAFKVKILLAMDASFAGCDGKTEERRKQALER
jgi:hypothetical protein